jgi:K+-sensing histidine kinase KdpD
MEDIALTATVVHDVKNALSVLVEQLAVLDHAGADSALSADIAAAHATARQVSAKLVNFLTLYRAHSSGLVVTPRDYNPEDFFHGVAAGLVLAKNAPSIACRLEPDTPAIWFFDGYLVQLALEAALQNAMRFARSQVTLSAGVCSEGLMLVVEDDGPGLDAGGAPSTGLRTQLCRAIAQAHVNAGRRGSIALFNHAQGGARFELRLP